MSVGGPISSIEFANRPFSVAADAEATRKLGGFENEIVSNGDGTVREIKTMVPLFIGGLVIDIDDDRDDQSFLQLQADTPGMKTLTVTYASGSTWQATAQIVDEITYNNQTTTAGIAFSGPGKLTKQ